MSSGQQGLEARSPEAQQRCRFSGRRSSSRPVSPETAETNASADARDGSFNDGSFHCDAFFHHVLFSQAVLSCALVLPVVIVILLLCGGG